MLAEMRSLLFVLEEGSVAKAAQRVGLSQPAVTKQLQRLEDALGGSLLDRRRKPYRLTPEGLRVAEQCRTILASVADLKGHFGAADAQGILRLGVATGFAPDRISAAVRVIADLHPRVAVRLTSDWSAALCVKLDDGLLDAALILSDEASSGPSLGIESLSIIGARDRLAGRTMTSRDLRSAPWVLSAEPCAARRALSTLLLRPGENLRIAAEVQDSHLQMRLVGDGLGLSMMPTRLVDQVADSTIATIGGFGVRLSMQMRRSPYLGALSRVIDDVEAAVRSALGDVGAAG
ncbi:DNA-binding transcriptional LysR family regulator [Sphingomonas sp. UYAg733]